MEDLLVNFNFLSPSLNRADHDIVGEIGGVYLSKRKECHTVIYDLNNTEPLSSVYR